MRYSNHKKLTFCCRRLLTLPQQQRGVGVFPVCPEFLDRCFLAHFPPITKQNRNNYSIDKKRLLITFHVSPHLNPSKSLHFCMAARDHRERVLSYIRYTVMILELGKNIHWSMHWKFL